MPDYQTSNYEEQGGARTVIGGSLDVASGGEIDIESGGALKIAGTAISSSAAELNILDGVNATYTEINKACDLSAQIQTITASGAVTAGVQAVYLNHATTAIASTIATTVPHQGLFLIKAGLEPGAGQDHTATITTGSWDGTNKVATFADIGDFLLVYFDAAGAGTILVNLGGVALS